MRKWFCGVWYLSKIGTWRPLLDEAQYRLGIGSTPLKAVLDAPTITYDYFFYPMLALKKPADRRACVTEFNPNAHKEAQITTWPIPLYDDDET